MGQTTSLGSDSSTVFSSLQLGEAAAGDEGPLSGEADEEGAEAHSGGWEEDLAELSTSVLLSMSMAPAKAALLAQRAKPRMAVKSTPYVQPIPRVPCNATPC